MKDPDRQGAAAAPGRDEDRLRRIRLAGSGLLVALVTVAVFWPVTGHEFILPWDDGKYVVNNPQVRRGLSWRGAGWALTTFHASNWHPLTWLSHMTDVELFGLDPSGHHAVNLLFHLATTLLLLAALARLTGSWNRSAAVAALFALHPLHVESVAWVAERKDVLSGFFFALTLALYAGYARRPSRGRYLAVAASLALGLLAKPMLVTLPLVLLLLDYWPLRRLERPHSRPAGERWSGWLLLREKLPLIGLSLVSATVTVLAQRRGGALAAVDQLPLGLRLSNSVVAYGTYLRRTFWPSDLAAYYPYPEEGLPMWLVVACCASLVGLTVLSVMQARRQPYLAVGWFLYLGMLVPVIGLVQVGTQATADRYTYLPLVGVFVALAWGAPALLEHAAYRAGMRAAAAARASGLLVVIALAALLPVTRSRVRVWENGVELFEDAVAVADCYRSRFNLGASLLEAGDLARSEQELRNALAFRPASFDAHYQLGRLYRQQGRAAEAAREYRLALRADPEHAPTLNDFGSLLAASGQMSEALALFTRAVAAAPDLSVARSNRGGALRHLGRLDEAEAEYREALRLAPDLGAAYSGLAMTLYLRGDDRGAWQAVDSARALGLEPNREFLRELSSRSPEPRR